MHVFVFSEVSRREATTKLFFGFPHDCPSKLLPLSGSGARTVWENKKESTTCTKLPIFFRILICFLLIFIRMFFKSNLQGQVHRPQENQRWLSGLGTFEHALRSLRPHIWQSGLHCKRAPVDWLCCSKSSVGKFRSLFLQLPASWEVLNRFEMSKHHKNLKIIHNSQNHRFSLRERPSQSKYWVVATDFRAPKFGRCMLEMQVLDLYMQRVRRVQVRKPRKEDCHCKLLYEKAKTWDENSCLQKVATWKLQVENTTNTVDGRNPAPVELAVYPSIYRVLACFSTIQMVVVWDFFHQSISTNVAL